MGEVITLSILMHIHLPLTGKPIRESLKKGTFDRCFIQFSAGDEDKVLIDDIKIVRIKEIIPTPKSLEATDLELGRGLTAHWESKRVEPKTIY